MLSIKDLGIILDNEFKYNLYIDTIVKKSLKLKGFGLRYCKEFPNINFVVILHNSLIRSNLDYCSII